jgi:hypothetical protein
MMEDGEIDEGHTHGRKTRGSIEAPAPPYMTPANSLEGGHAGENQKAIGR